MKLKLSYPTIFATLILALLISTPFIAKRFSESQAFYFKVKMISSSKGVAELFYDIGYGYRPEDSSRINITTIDTPITYKFRLHRGNYRALRLDPINREATVTILEAGIFNPYNDMVMDISAEQFGATQQIQSLEIKGQSVVITTIKRAFDPILEISLDGPFSLKTNQRRMLLKIGLAGLTLLLMLIPCWSFLWLTEKFFIRHRERVICDWRELTVLVTARPKTAIGVIAIFAVVLSCYPVVFFDKSFVSPNNATHLLYETFPTLPGYEDQSLEDAKGSDVGAMMWAHLPYSVIQRRAIFQDFELPLWNRYNSTGLTLFGQGQSIFGDPLHMIVLLSGDTARAWDIKFLLAKIFFAAGIGLTIYTVTLHLPSSLVLAFSSAFIGFFSFRFNHPAFFSLTYSPWILYCWFRIVQARATSTSAFWMGGLILSNWMVMNSGTVKEAYMLIIFLNLCGLIVLLLAQGDRRLKLKKYLQLLLTWFLFVLISAPVWFTFLDALNQSYTSYDVPSVQQTQPWLLLGFFDDIFYRQLMTHEVHFNPSANFVILFGFLWSLTRVKALLSNRTYLAVALSSLVSFSLVFGIIPPGLIIKIPFLANVVHINNTFSCVLIVHMIVMAGFGLKECWERFAHEEWTREWVVTILMLFALFGLYFGSTPTVHKSEFFYGYSFSLVLAFVSLPIITKHIILRKTENSAVALLLLLIIAFVGLHWRHGMHLKTGLDNYVVNPKVRVNLQAKSPSIEFIKSKPSQPFRTMGFGANLFPGYNAVFGIESIYGADALINPFYREFTKLLPIEWGWDWRIIIREDTLVDLKPIYDFFNVKYYLATHSAKPSELPGLKLSGSFDLDVYRSDSVWPRAFITDTLSSYEAPSDFVGLVKEGDGRPFAAVHRDELEQNSILKNLLGDQKQRRIVSATDYKLTNNTTSFSIIAPKKGIIVLSEAYLKRDFQVTVNGEPTRYFRVNHVFKGIVIDKPGTYNVTVSYWPQYFTLSLWVSGVGLLMLFVFMGYSWQARERKGEALVGKS